MLNLRGKHIHLRALEPEDIDFLYDLENNTSIWEISGTLLPFSKHILKKYIENAHLDIYEIKQLRLCICDTKDKAIGLIDLFDFDPKNRRAGVGIIVFSDVNKNKGYGHEALILLENYAKKSLELHQLFANILDDNNASIHLFEKMNYSLVGSKRDWILSEGKFKNELLYQKIIT